MTDLTFNPGQLYEKYEHVMGGGWGHHIEFFGKCGIPADNLNGTIHFSGHLPFSNRVEVGQKIVCEYVKTWIVYEFTEVDYKRDPPDMFFAKAHLFEAYDKETSEKTFDRSEMKRGSGIISWVKSLMQFVLRPA